MMQWWRSLSRCSFPSFLSYSFPPNPDTNQKLEPIREKEWSTTRQPAPEHAVGSINRLVGEWDTFFQPAGCGVLLRPPGVTYLYTTSIHVEGDTDRASRASISWRHLFRGSAICQQPALNSSPSCFLSILLQTRTHTRNLSAIGD